MIAHSRVSTSSMTRINLRYFEFKRKKTTYFVAYILKRNFNHEIRTIENAGHWELAIAGAGESFVAAKTWITAKFTWLYIGSQDVWAVIIVVIYFSKYGKIKLGM